MKTRRAFSLLHESPDVGKTISAHIVSNFTFDSALDPSTNFDSLAQTIRDSISAHLPPASRSQHTSPWMTPAVTLCRKNYHQTRRDFSSTRSSANKALMANSAKQLAIQYSKDYAAYLDSLSKSILESTGDNLVRGAWETINILTNRKFLKSGLIPAEDDNARLLLWHQHFKSLLSPGKQFNRSDLHLTKVFNGLSFVTGPFSFDELDAAINAFQNNKASGIDEIPAEIFKNCCGDLRQVLLDLLNLCYTSGQVPSTWHESLIVPVFKKGDPNVCGNYRGIALMSICAKLYNRLLLIRLRNGLDAYLSPNQNGFRPLRSTGQHVLCLKRLIEEFRKSKDGRLISLFIDFSKAFDSIDWNYMENILLAYDVPVVIVRAIMSVYVGAKARVRMNDKVSEPFDLGVGVLQGDTLAPYLFVVVLDWVLRNAIPDESLGAMLSRPRGTRSRPILGKYLTYLAYADDIALLASSLENILQLLHSVEHYAQLVGLKINVAKTEYLLIGDWSSQKNSPNGFHIASSNGSVLQEVPDFKYLGSWILNTESDFKVRIANAWSAARKLNRIWKNKILPRDIKLRVFDALVLSILLYNATTWTMNKTLCKKLDGAHCRLLRYALNINWRQHIRNDQVLKDIEPLSNQLKRRRLIFAGHCWRSGKCPSSSFAIQPVSDLLFWRAPGPNTRGRPRSNYLDILLDESMIQPDRRKDEIAAIETLQVCMENRKSWKTFIKEITS